MPPTDIIAAGACCSAGCLQPTMCPATMDASLPLRGWANKWVSPDPHLARYGLRFIQIGGDTWNRCGPGWLNMDGNFDRGDVTPPLPANAPFREDTIYVDDTDRYNMRHVVSSRSRLPFRDGSVQLIYSEHMLEHMLPSEGGVNFLREAYRVLAPGGLLRLVTPDVDKYACAFVDRSGGENFLEKHAARFQPMETKLLGMPPSRATVLNNIFRNYGHQWVYNFDELKRAARAAGIPSPEAAPCRSDRVRFDRGNGGGLGLPKWARQVMRRANNALNDSQTCWLDQAVREGESMYVNIRKPA